MVEPEITSSSVWLVELRTGKRGKHSAGYPASTPCRGHITLLDAGTIPSTKAGTHRRVRLRDVLAYRQQRGVRNRNLLDEALSYAQGTEDTTEGRARSAREHGDTG